MKRHAASLSEVFLRAVNLRRTSWVKFLPEMRRILLRSDIARAGISGALFGENEDTQEAEFWDAVEPTHGSSPLTDSLLSYLLCREDHEHGNPFEVYFSGWDDDGFH